MSKTFLDLLAAVVVVCAAYVVYDQTVDRPVGGTSIVARVAPAVAKQPTKLVSIKKPVKVYAGNSKANLKLTPEIIADANKQVLAATQTQPSLRPQTVTTVIDTETGETKNYVKEDPYPWLAVERRGEVSLSYGYKFRGATGAPVTRAALSYDVVRIKAITAGVRATVDSDRDVFVGLTISYKF